jgi:glyoxylate reductase
MAHTRKRRPLVFVTRMILHAALARLERATRVAVWPGESPPLRRELLRRLKNADAVLSMVTDRIDAAAIASALRLRVISNLAVGVDNIDLAAATRAGIAVGHTPGILTETTADLAFALLLATARRVTEGDRQVRAGAWKTWGPLTLLGRDVHGATLGIVGFGAIGQAMARRASGFAMRVLYARRRASGAVESIGRRLGARAVPFEHLLRESDFVSLHVPLTAATRHLIAARELRLMKPGAILINTSRGAVVDQRALVRELRAGRLGGAGLDVTDPEPVRRDDPLLKAPGVVITPHIGSASHATRARMAELAADNILAVLAGRRPRYCANSEVRLRPRDWAQPDR